MASTGNSKAKKIAALGIAGAVITQIVPTAALGNEKPTAVDSSNLRCTTSEPIEVKNAPTEAQISEKEAQITEKEKQLEAGKAEENKARDAAEQASRDLETVKNKRATGDQAAENLLEELQRILDAEKAKNTQAVAEAETAVEQAQNRANETRTAAQKAREKADADRGMHLNKTAVAQQKDAEYTDALKPTDYTATGEKPNADDIQTRIDALNADLQNLTAQKTRKNAELAQLQQSKQTAEEAAQQITTELGEISARKSQVAAQLNEKTQQLTEAQNRETQARNALKQAEDEAGRNSSNYQAKTRELETARQNAAAAAREIEKINAQITELTQQRSEKQTQKETAEAQSTEKTAEIAQLQKQITAIDEQLRENTTQTQQLQRRKEEIETRLAEIEREMGENSASGENNAGDGGTPDSGNSTGSENPAGSAETEENKQPAESKLLKPSAQAAESALYRVENGQAVRITQLSAAPGDLQNYVLRSRNEDGKISEYKVVYIEVDPAGGFTATGNLAENTVVADTITVEIAQNSAPQAGVYTSFAKLLEALNRGENNVTLGSDLYADEIPDIEEATYVSQEFTGNFNGAGYTIYGLKKPFFNTLAAQATVTDLNLKNVETSSTGSHTGALANQAMSARISGVHVSGRVIGENSVGGVVGQASGGTQISDVTFAGTIFSVGRSAKTSVGGLVAHMQGGNLSQAGFQGDIYSVNNLSTTNRIGGVVGHLEENGTIINVYAGGNLYNVAPGAQAGGLAGSLWADSRRHGRIRGGVAAMNVRNGMQVLGDKNHTTAAVAGVSAWEGEAQGGEENPRKVFVLGGEDVEAHYESLNLSKNLRANNFTPPQTNTPLAANRQLAYENYRMLLPYAQAETLVLAVNALPENDPLLSKKLLSALPTVNGVVTADAIRDKNTINGVILHFADDTVDRRVLARDSRKTTISTAGQYYMNRELPYTPQQLNAVDTAVVTRIVDALKAREWAEITIPENAAYLDEHKTVDNMRAALYLKETYHAQRETLHKQISELLAYEMIRQGGSVNSSALEKKILDNKDQVLLGLTYLNKWYSIDFNGNTLRDLLLTDFGGTKVSSLDLLIKLGSDYRMLDPRRNQHTYQEIAFPITKQANIFDALDVTRQQFTNYSNFDDWFKATSKAYIVEAPSAERPDVSVKLTEKLKANSGYHNMVLPLLTVSEGKVWLTVHMSSIGFGSFEKYYNVEKVTDPAAVAQKIAEIKQLVDAAGEKYREYFDMWYRIGNETMRKNLIATVPVWDGFSSNRKWSEKYGPGALGSVEEFYGPVGKWFPANGLAGYSNRNGTWMVASSMLHPGYNLSIYTHEMTHNISYRVMLGGYGERTGSHAELYPTSFLQNPHSRKHDTFGFNQADHYAGQTEGYFHNEHPDRFANLTDLEHYFKGYFEALYLLDNVEADAILSQDNETKTRLLLRLGKIADENRGHLNHYQPLTVEELDGMNLQTIRDLVENELMIHRGHTPGSRIRSGSYVGVSVMNPLYGTGESEIGITGEASFKRNAYELLAAKGFEGGWVPYTSDKYREEAAAAGYPSLPDTFIMSKIFSDGSFRSLKEYRQHAYEANRERAQQLLKPITLNFLGKEETFRTYDELAQRFQAYMTADLAVGFENNTNRSRVLRFKRAVFSALMEQTDEFRTSIFTDGDENLPPRVPVKTAVVLKQPYAPTLLATPELETNAPAYDTATAPEAEPETDPNSGEETGSGTGAETNPGTDSGAGSGSGTGEGSNSGADTPGNQGNNSELAAERQRLETELADVKERLQQLEQSAAEFTATKQNLETDKDRKQGEAEALNQQIQQLQTALEENQQQLTDLQTQSSEENQRQQKAQQQQMQAQQQLAKMDQRVAQATANVDNAVTAREVIAVEKAAVAAQLETVTNSYDGKNAELTAKRAEITGLETQIAAAEEFLETTAEDISEREAEVARLRDLLAKQMAAAQAQTDAERARTQSQLSEQTAQEAEAAAQQAQTVVSDSRGRLQAALDKQAVLRDETVESLIAEPTKADAYPELADRLERYRRLSADAQAVLREHAQQVAQAEAKLREAQAHQQQVAAEVKELEKQLTQARSELEEMVVKRKQAIKEQTVTECTSLKPEYLVLPEANIYEIINGGARTANGHVPQVTAEGAVRTVTPVAEAAKLRLANTGSNVAGVVFVMLGAGGLGVFLTRRVNRQR